MPKINQEILEQLEQIASEYNIVIDAQEKERFLNWQIEPLKKVWIAGKMGQTQNPVFIKLRPLHSLLSLDLFVESETTDNEVAKHLKAFKYKIPQTIVSQFEKSPEWVVREFVVGKPIGEILIDKNINAEELFQFLVRTRQSLDEVSDQVNLKTSTPEQVQQRWMEEYKSRASFVVKLLGVEVAEKLATRLKQPMHFSGKSWLIHTDLAPQNILQIETGEFSLIDWGGSAMGSRAIDWATVWLFAAKNPELQEKILNEARAESQSPEELLETNEVFLCFTARLIATFAENYYYFIEKEDKKDLAEEANFGTQVAWQNFQKLEKEMNV